jgi:hypothetical protein
MNTSNPITDMANTVSKKARVLRQADGTVPRRNSATCSSKIPFMAMSIDGGLDCTAEQQLGIAT